LITVNGTYNAKGMPDGNNIISYIWYIILLIETIVRP